jgi:hypothetical protein
MASYFKDNGGSPSKDLSHPPVITHRRKNAKGHQRIDSGRIFEAPIPVGVCDAVAMKDFGKTEAFPDGLGVHIFGSLEKGYARFLAQKLRPENVSTQYLNVASALQLIIIDRRYFQKASPLPRIHVQ